MKIIIRSIIILFCVLSNAQNEANKLEIDIRGKDCNGGLSFCTIEANTENKIVTSKFSLQKISETEIQFVIKINELTKEEQKILFDKEFYEISNDDKFNFTQNYDFQLNPDCIKILQLNSKYSIIKKGIYPINLIDERAIIILKLTNNI